MTKKTIIFGTGHENEKKNLMKKNFLILLISV